MEEIKGLKLSYLALNWKGFYIYPLKEKYISVALKPSLLVSKM